MDNNYSDNDELMYFPQLAFGVICHDIFNAQCGWYVWLSIKAGIVLGLLNSSMNW